MTGQEIEKQSFLYILHNKKDEIGMRNLFATLTGTGYADKTKSVTYELETEELTQGLYDILVGMFGDESLDDKVIISESEDWTHSWVEPTHECNSKRLNEDSEHNITYAYLNTIRPSVRQVVTDLNNGLVLKLKNAGYSFIEYPYFLRFNISVRYTLTDDEAWKDGNHRKVMVALLKEIRYNIEKTNVHAGAFMTPSECTAKVSESVDCSELTELMDES